MSPPAYLAARQPAAEVTALDAPNPCKWHLYGNPALLIIPQPTFYDKQDLASARWDKHDAIAGPRRLVRGAPALRNFTRRRFCGPVAYN